MKVLVLTLSVVLFGILFQLASSSPPSQFNDQVRRRLYGGTQPNQILTRQQRVPIDDLQKSLKILANWASRNLSTVFNTVTRKLYYQRKFQCTLVPLEERSEECRRPINDNRPDRPPLTARLEKRNGEYLVKNLSKELEEKMLLKMEAVRKSGKYAEKIYTKYNYDENLKGITYFNAKRINRPHLVDQYFGKTNKYRNFTLAYNTHFKADVNLSHSIVHVPTNVFDGSAEINNGAEWTKKLNKRFAENRVTDPDMFWQYFGSALGFYRVFPGSKWLTGRRIIDMFDCRTKGWYIKASASPKDLVILLDASGSMLGLRFRIAMNTVDQILKTLGEDDFFNIIKFNSKVEYVDQCFNGTLLQATAENKERLRRKIRGIEPQKMADFEKALTEAFLLFNQTAHDRVGSMCNRAIMLITDGAPDTYDELFDEYNSPNTTFPGLAQIRLFSFLIGQDPSYNKEINLMACNNKGYYVDVKTIAAVQDNMKQYVTTLARPLALSGINEVTWTSIYIDDAEYEYASRTKKKKRRSGMKVKKRHIKGNMPVMSLMASVAGPVYDKRPGTDKQDLLGVIGTDLPIHFLKSIVPPPKLGVNAYSFAVNHNGYILFHPFYKPPYKAPDYTNLDLAKLEMPFIPWAYYNKMREYYFGPILQMGENGTETWVEVPQNDSVAAMGRVIDMLNRPSPIPPDYTLKLRDAMVRGDTGKYYMVSNKAAEHRTRAKVIPMHYYYTPIPYTPFTLAIVIPGFKYDTSDYGFVYMNATLNMNKADLSTLEEREGLQTKFPSQWSYCKFTAEELEVQEEDYHNEVLDMYFKYEEELDNGQIPDILDDFMPSVLPEVYCADLKDQMLNDENIMFVNDTTTIYNRTAVEFYNNTFSTIDQFAYLTEANVTLYGYSFNETKCQQSVRFYHIDQLREQSTWMFEKKFMRLLRAYIEKGRDGLVKDFREKCDIPTIETLLFDAELTNDTRRTLTPPMIEYHDKMKVSMIFLATRSGLTRYVTPDHAESDFINMNPEAIRELYYIRAVQAGPDTMLVTVDEFQPWKEKRIILTQALYVSAPTDDGTIGQTAVAVAGMEMLGSVFGQMVFTQPCDDTGLPCDVQCSNETLCYILDDNGYIVYAEEDALIGGQLPYIDPDLFIQLTNFYEIIDNGSDAKQEPVNGSETVWDSLYELIFFDHHQVICPILQNASPALLLNPFTALSRFIILSLWNILSTLIYFGGLVKGVLITKPFNVTCLTVFADPDSSAATFINCTEANKIPFEEPEPPPRVLGTEVCTKRFNVYRLNEKATRLSGAVTEGCRDCSKCKITTSAGECFGCPGEINGTLVSNATHEEMPNCNRTWRVQIVPKTNLVLLVVSNLCTCQSDINIQKLLAGKILKHKDDTEQCQLLKMERHRRAPDECVNEHPNENVSVCGKAACLFRLSIALLIISISLNIMLQAFNIRAWQ